MADYFDKARHDFSITDPSTSDVLGFLCKRDPQSGRIVFNELDGDYLADQFFTGAPSQQFINPEIELLLGQDDWRSGYGLEIYDSADTKRYYSSIGCDMRFRGQGILSWGSTAIAMPTTLPAITDGALEVWTDASTLTNWTTAAGSVSPTRNTANKEEGTYCCEFAVNSQTGEVYQNASNWATSFQNTTIIVTARVWCNRASKARIYLDDGVDTTYSSYHSGGSAYETLTVQKKLGAAATRIRVGLKVVEGVAQATTAYYDDVQFHLTTGAVVASATFNSLQYFAMGKSIYKLNGTGDGWTFVGCLPATITDMAVFTDDVLYIALGTSTPYYAMSTAEVFTRNTLSNNTMQYFAVVHTASPTMWANGSGNTIRSTTNPADGGTAWSATTTVGSASFSITDLLGYQGTLVIAKANRPYYLDSSSNVQDDLAAELESAYATTSGKNLHEWLGALYYPAGDQALLEASGTLGSTTNTFRNPARYGTNLTEFVGRVFAIAHDEEWLIVAIDNGTKIEIMVGRLEIVGSITSWVWHPIHELTLTGVETLFTSTVYKKRLWICSTLASDSVYYLPLPTEYGDITNDDNRNFLTGGSFITPWLHGGFMTDTKGLIRVQVAMGHAYDVDIYWECHFQKLGDTTWTDMGDMKGSATDRTAELFRTTATSSPMFRFKFVGITDDTTKTPSLLRYTVQAILFPTIRTLYQTIVRVGDGVTDRIGMSMANKTELQKTCLDNARAATWLVDITQLDGTAKKVKFLPLPQNTPRRNPVYDEKGFIKEWEYNLLMLSVDTS